MVSLKTEGTYLDAAKVSVKGFWTFCKNQKILVFLTGTVLLLCYGIKMTNVCIGIDTELHMTTQHFLNWMSIGRFVLVWLQLLWTSFMPGKTLFNPYLAVLLGCIFLFFATLSWCYIIYLFSNGTGRKISYWLFAVCFLSHQVWGSQIYFVCQAAEVMLIVLCSPFIVWLLFKGAMAGSPVRLACGVMATVLCTGVYQSCILFIACGICIAGILFMENSDCPHEFYVRVCARLATCLVAAMLIHFFLNKSIQRLCSVQESDYLSDQFKFKISRKSILNMLLYMYKLTVAKVPGIREIAELVVSHFARTGRNAIVRLRHDVSWANTMFLPAVICYFILSVQGKKRSLCYTLAVIAVPLLILVFPLLGGGKISLRVQFVLPLSMGFIFWYVTDRFSGKLFITASLLIAITCWQQVLTLSMLNYCDVAAYRRAERLSAEIMSRIHALGESEDTPVFMYGKYDINANDANFIDGDGFGSSPFSNPSSPHFFGPVQRGVSFMQFLGYKISAPENRELALKAITAGGTMPVWPAPGSVKSLGDVIVVKFSDDASYEW